MAGSVCVSLILTEVFKMMTKKISRILKNKQSFLKGFRLGLASLPLFFMNLGQTQPSILRDDGIASDWKNVGSDLRNVMTREIGH